jgi:hypothetical protein
MHISMLLTLYIYGIISLSLCMSYLFILKADNAVYIYICL